jgi:D-amino peptidase
VRKRCVEFDVEFRDVEFLVGWSIFLTGLLWVPGAKARSIGAMKIFLSADIEGVAGITHWDEASIGAEGYEEFRGQMTREVKAACEGAVAAGAREIWVKDAHDSGRNILTEELPECVRVVRGWSGHPSLMMQELDESFDAVMMVGYHSTAGSGGNPLEHSISLQVARMELNGEPASEFLLHAYEAARHGVPVALVTGDEGICAQAGKVLPRAATVAVTQGIGRSTVSLHPLVAADRIHAAAAKALSKSARSAHKPLALPKRFKLELRYKDAAVAYRAGFYPGVRQVDATQVSFETSDFFEVMRMLLFTTAELPSQGV